MNQEEELKKQQLLIAEIIEQGYDQDEFEGYLNQIAPEKTDLESWTFQDLYLICFQFQRSKFKQGDNKRDDLTFKVSKIFKPIELIQKKKQIKINDTSFIEEFHETVPCRKEKYFIEKGQILQFEIEAIKTGFKITTKPYGWQVRRSLADFKKLQELLLHLYPEIIMSKFLFEETPEPKDLIQTLKDFLNQFNKQEIFRTQMISYYFLHGEQVNPSKSFIEIANQFKITPSFSLQNKQSPKEALEVKLTQESFIKYQQIQHYVKNFATQHDSVEEQIKTAIGKIEQAEESLNQVVQALSPLLELKPFEELKQTIYQKQFASKAIIFITEFQETIKKTKKLFEDTFNQILKKMNENHQAQIQTLENCQEIQKIFLQDHKKFVNSQPTLLQKLEVQEVLKKHEHIKKVYKSDKIHISNIDYEKLCLILRQELPLQVPNEFEEYQQKKFEFAYMIQETCAGVQNLDKEDTTQFSKILDQAIREIISECDRRKQNAENILGIEEYQ